jgi:hypothetical protein
MQAIIATNKSKNKPTESISALYFYGDFRGMFAVNRLNYLPDNPSLKYLNPNYQIIASV